MSPSVVATSSAAAFWGPNLCSKASSCNFHMIHIRLVQNSWTQEKAGSFTLALAALAWTNSFVDVENVLASENHLEIVDLPHLWHDRDPSGSPPDWIRLGRWSCLMIKSSLWNFVPPGDIVLGEKPIVITTGHLIILILIYSDHHKPHDVQARTPFVATCRPIHHPRFTTIDHRSVTITDGGVMFFSMVMILPEQLPSLQLTARPCQG